jgi:hypothetical protein
MLFRLLSGELLTLRDECVDLCKFFVQLQGSEHPLVSLTEWLKKGESKKHHRLFLQLVEELKPRFGDEEVLALSQPSSPFVQELRAKCAAHEQHAPELFSVLEEVIQHHSEVFDPAIHHLKFITKDQVLQHVVTYLEIPSTLRAEDMFASLPYLIKGGEQDVDLKTVVEPPIHPYLDFASQLSDEMLLDLTKASCLLGITTLTMLLSCHFARVLNDTCETEIRKRFEVPSHLKSTTMEKLRAMVKDHPWAQFVGDSSKQRTVLDSDMSID